MIEAAINKLRQQSFIPFWRGKIEVTPHEKIQILLRDSRTKDSRGWNILESAAHRRSSGAFVLKVANENRYASGNCDRPSIWMILKNGSEWSDAIKDAWRGVENANQWFLTDNALKVFEWIKGPKNTGEFVPENRLGAQADLRGTGSYSRISEYVKEIGLKTPYTVQVERNSRYGGDYKLKLIPQNDRPTSDTFHNPVFAKRISCHDKESLDAYAHMLTDRILEGEFGDEKKCLLFNLNSRTDLLKAFPDLAEREAFTPHNMEEFLESVRLPKGLEVGVSLNDEAKDGWRLGAVLEDGWTWEKARESIREVRDRNDPCKTYGLSPKAGKILNWIWNLHDNEIYMGMTPCVENAARTQIGVEKLDYGPNSKVILQLLIYEINEKTPYSLGLIPWYEYPRDQHRLLIRKKENPEAVITRLIQIRGLEKNIALSASDVEKAIDEIWMKGTPLSESSISSHH